MKRLHPAQPAWQAGQLRSPAYDDIYFSGAGAQQESRHVFLQGNDLPARMAAAGELTIGETGFGTGLNFLTTLACWRRCAPDGARLHYLAVEKHPFTRNDLERVLAGWPDLAQEARALLEVWPALVEGIHRRELWQGRVSLTLLFGDAAAQLARCQAQVDAWFLDGFAPARNPEMWSATLLGEVARLSAAGATVATFTVAGEVRRRLQAAGFVVEKRPGFGAKRHMLAGRLAPQDADKTAVAKRTQSPWYALPPLPAPASRHALVIGAGLAGLTCAHALARRGWQVTVLEQAAAPARAASGNPAGILMPRLARDMAVAARFYLSAFEFSRHWLAALQRRQPDLVFEAPGVLQLMSDAARQACAELPLPPDVVRPLERQAAEARLGMSVSRGGLWFAGAGWTDPRSVCASLLQEAGAAIELRTHTGVTALQAGPAGWAAKHGESVLVTAPVVILANGAAAEALAPGLAWQLQAVRGQLTYLGARDGPQLACPVCYDGYITPASDGQYCVGASFDPAAHEPALTRQDEQANLTALHRALPAFAGQPVVGGRVAFRTSTPDHLPLIGPVPDADFYAEHYADLHHGRPAHRYPAAQYRPGLYISSGHGSRGLISTPLAAELIAAQLHGEPLPLATPVLDAIHPARFLVRRYRRRPKAEPHT